MTCHIVALGGGIGLSVTHFNVKVGKVRVHTVTVCLVFVTIYISKTKPVLL